MISVGSRDERKGLGLGFGGGREMEETELEEGEACFYQDDDANIDPDVALSYLDEKVQVVLGHFQKDFEGGVSAENLGAKFGGYGSFLPTHQRSPSIWSHPRTPQKVQNFGTPTSPNNLPVEGARQNSAVPSSATAPVKLGPASTSVPPPPVTRAPSVDNSTKRDVYLSSMGSGEFTPKHEPVNRSINSTDHKTLKVRIKVGPDSMAQKNAAIYSGLGLDISPSSSPEDSPIESGGLSPESQNTPEKSPTSILQVMTSFPVPGGFLLSPLSDSLLDLMEKEKLLKDSRFGLAWKNNQERSGMLVVEPPSVKVEEKVFGEKKMKSVEKSGRSMEVKNGNNKDAGNEISALLKKEIDIETPAGKELVSNALKLPILSSSKCIGETAKGTSRSYDVTREGNKSVVKEKFFSSDFAREEVFDSVGTQDLNRAEKRNANSSADKVWEDKKSSSLKDVQAVPRKDGRKKCDKSDDAFQAGFDGSKGRKDFNGGPTDCPKEKVSKKSTSFEQDGSKMAHGKEQLSSKGKKKSKGTQSNGNPSIDFQKESLRVVSSATSKDKMKIEGDYLSETKMDDNRLHKDSGQTRESQRDLFGDVKMEHTENMLETPFRDRPKETKLEVAEKETHSFADKSKDRSVGKKVDNPLVSEAYPKAPSVVTSHSTANVLGSDSVPALVAPLVIEENWVACDRCQKWRLLPFGTNPQHLPKKWLCSMLNWLPGMNRCNVSEEETTKALNALYQVPVPESQNNLLSQPALAASGATLAEVHNLDQAHQDHTLHPMPILGKKKHGPKEIPNADSCTGPMHLSDLTRKDQQASMKSRSLSDVHHSSLESNQGSKAGFQQLSKSSDSGVEKQRQRQKEKHKLVQDGGDSKHSKTKNKREADQDGSKASKKTKIEGLSSSYEDWNSDHGGITGKIGTNSNSGLSARVSGKNVQKHDEYSFSKYSMGDAKDSLPVPVRKLKDSVQVSLDGGTLDMGKSDTKDIAVKKRKVKEWQESQNYPPETLQNTGHHVQDNKAPVNEVTSESELKKEKKAKVHKSDRKESRTSKDDDRADKKGRITRILMSGSKDPVGDGREEEGRGSIKDQQLGYRGGTAVSQRTLDGIDSLKRDLGYGQSSTAATSSSSKVSGSHKSKANFQEVKGSPVESVSSSPLRISNPDKVTSARRMLLGKEDATNVGLSVSSPRRCSDGEWDGGNNRPGTGRKEKASSVIRRESLESSILDHQDRDANRMSGGKAKGHTEPSLYELDNHLSGGADTLDQHNQYPVELNGKKHDHDEERVNNNQYRSNGSLPKKATKVSSSRSKDKQKASKSDLGKGKNKVPNLSSEQEELHPTNNSRYEETELHNHTPCHGESRDGKYNLQDKYGVKSGKDEISYSDKKSGGKWSSESRKENQSKFGGHDGSDVKSAATCFKDGRSNPQQNLQQDHEVEKSSNRILSERTDQMDTASGRGKSQLLPHSGDKQETLTRCPRPMPGTSGGGGDSSKMPKQPRRPENQNGTHHSSLRNCTTNGLVSDLDAPSPVRKDSFTQAAANALKEAKDLKHTADRVKNFGSVLETTGLYFQAALKFLHGASLLEASNNESAKHGEMTQSMVVYSSTAKLCAFVAHEYERCKEMAAAALAYKCMEVAYMRVIYFKHSSASKDRHELQTALQMVPPGESPSSSASDVDNLNQGTLDKLASAKGVNSPHVAGNHVIVAKNRPNFVRLLNFAEDVNFAMEASRKSQNAFAAANVSMEEARHQEGISSIKRALDFNFHDVQGLLRLVRLAMEAISR
ncbi:zinc finger protein [Macleaya cordata]|uniref:Zinc finger protein n=1 Tax=Macleaya cordata TaxID=56857 RepID=A0A200QX50_MACCD|nr:zinc finger protein [Macleaya cordata]